MNDIFNNYCNPKLSNQVASFMTIYIAEAHANDEWWLPDSPEAHVGGKAYIGQHKTMEERLEAARKLINDHSLEFDVVCDSMNNDIYEFYDAWPERLFIIEKGIVVYKGGPGPFEYKLAEVKDWLIERYGLRGESISRR